MAALVAERDAADATGKVLADAAMEAEAEVARLTGLLGDEANE